MARDGRKYCPACQREHALSLFGKDKRSADGLSRYCRASLAERMRDWKRRNPEKVAAANAARNAKMKKALRLLNAATAKPKAAPAKPAAKKKAPAKKAA